MVVDLQLGGGTHAVRLHICHEHTVVSCLDGHSKLGAADELDSDKLEGMNEIFVKKRFNSDLVFVARTGYDGGSDLFWQLGQSCFIAHLYGDFIFVPWPLEFDACDWVGASQDCVELTLSVDFPSVDADDGVASLKWDENLSEKSVD